MKAKDLKTHLDALKKHSANWRQKMDQITDPKKLEKLKVRFSNDMIFYSGMANKYRSMREAYNAEVNTYADLLKYANRKLETI
jgi:hypothetical protein